MTNAMSYMHVIIQSHMMQTKTGYAVIVHSLSNRKGNVGQVLCSQEFSELFLLLLLLSFCSHG